MFDKNEIAAGITKLKYRVEILEEEMKELKYPRYAKGKKIRTLEDVLNPSRDYHDPCVKSIGNAGLADFAKEVAEYYLELEKEYRDKEGK
jgi:hypothetical protein